MFNKNKETLIEAAARLMSQQSEMGEIKESGEDHVRKFNMAYSDAHQITDPDKRRAALNKTLTHASNAAGAGTKVGTLNRQGIHLDFPGHAHLFDNSKL